MPVESGSDEAPPLPDYSKALLDQLTGEYRIVQDKIDKLAGFRFTIRGWSVTLVVAFAFGANTLKLPPYWILSALLPLVAFFLMERSQQRNHDILSLRALRLEKRIWRTLRLSAPPGVEVMIGGMVPRLGHELVEEAQSAHPAIRWLRSMGDIIFYGAQILLVVVAAVWVNRLQQQTVPDREQTRQSVTNNVSPENAGKTEGTPDGKTQTRRRTP